MCKTIRYSAGAAVSSTMGEAVSTVLPSCTYSLATVPAEGLLYSFCILLVSACADTKTTR